MITNPQTITESFINWLESEGVATFGQDLYLRRVPDSQKTPSSLYWIIPSGGFPLGRNKTGEMIKQYTFVINYRSTKAEDVEHKLYELEELLNCQSCIALEGYQVLEVEVSVFPDDGDVDDEDREVRLLQVNIKTYKQRC